MLRGLFRPRGAVRALTVLSLFLVIAPSKALAQEEEGLSEQASLEMDAEIIAATNGWTFEDTMDYLVAQAAFTDLVSRIAATYPDDFSSSTNLMSPEDVPELYFKGRCPTGARDLIAEAAIAVDIYEDIGRNAAEWDARVIGLADWLQSEGVSSYVVSFDGIDSIRVVLGNGRSVPESLPAAYATSDVHFEIELEALTTLQDSGVHGGGEAWNGTIRDCTFAWCVQDSNGTRGVLTAAHCSGLDLYENPETSDQYSTSFQAQHIGSWGDFEWHTTDGPEWPNWYADNDWSLRRMDSVKTTWSNGDATCVFGMTSLDRMCTTIYDKSASIDGHNYMVVTVAGDTLGGDRGAGWSSGTEAQGIHTGLTYLGGALRSYYSRAERVDNALSVDLCVSP